MEGVCMHFPYKLPTFCHECGSIYPWADRMITNAVSLVAMDENLSPQEIHQFKTDLMIVAKNGPETKIASIRAKKILSKVGTAVSSGVFEIVVSILSEKGKQIFLG